MSAVPTKLAITSTGTTANSNVSKINAAWSTATNGVILNYEMQYETDASSKPSWCMANQRVSVATTAISVPVCPRNTYSIRIRAFTRKGAGPWSDPQQQVADARGEFVRKLTSFLSQQLQAPIKS